MVCSIHHETITALIASNICSFFAAPGTPLVDLNRKMMATRLAMDAADINTKRKVLLESCNLAIFLTSSGCDVMMITQSMNIMVKAQPTHVSKDNAGAEALW